MSNRKKTSYKTFFKEISNFEKILVQDYFSQIRQKVWLPKRQLVKMLSDFENAIMYYYKAGFPIEKALNRLSVENLGDFYCAERMEWYPLDNAAKIYPLSMSNNWMAVFRLSVYLKDEIIPEILQIALTYTIKRFPVFATTIKKGFFWHYIDSTNRRFAVERETRIPCSSMNVSGGDSPSFRVVYFQNRISVECFHILTDGTGGIIFLKTLVAEYLRLLGVDIPACEGILDINEPPHKSEWANDFKKAKPIPAISGFVDKPAVQMNGRRSKAGLCRIVHFDFDSAQLKQAAKRRNTTVSALLLAFMFVACKAASADSKANIQIQVPVNMRKFHASNTLRNFALYCSIRIPRSNIGSIDELLPEIARQLQENSSEEAMNKMMSTTAQLVHVLKYIPLFVKRPVAKLVYGVLGDKVFTTTLSNLGVVKVPDKMLLYIRAMDALGASVTNRAFCGMVTIGETATFTISKTTADTTFEDKMLNLMRGCGLTPAVSESGLYGYK